MNGLFVHWTQMLQLPTLLQVAIPTPPAPNYSPQLEAIAQALNHHEVIPGWFLGTVLGFGLGLFAEPVKSWIQKRLSRRRAERLLLAEVKANCFMGQLFVAAPGLPRVLFSTEKYDHLREKDLTTVFEIDQAGSLNRLYRSFQEIAAGPREQRTHAITYEFSLFEDAVKRGVMGRYFKNRLDKEGSPLRHIAAKYVPPSAKEAAG